MVHRPMALADVDETLALLPAQVSADAARHMPLLRSGPTCCSSGPAVAKRPDGGPGAAAGPAHPLGWGAILLSPAQAQACCLDAEPYLSRATRVCRPARRAGS